MYGMMKLHLMGKLIRRDVLFVLFMSYFSLVARPLNILFVVGHFPAPSQTFILNQMTRLIERGHNVKIFSFHYDEYNTLHPDIVKYNLLDRLIYDDIPTAFPECDIVLCQFGYLGTRILKMPQLTQWLEGKKIITCFRGADVTSKPKKKPHMYEALFMKGDLFLPVCEFLKNKLVLLGCDRNRIHVHYSAIDCSRFTCKQRKFPENGRVRFISVCRLVEKKGIDIAIRAIANLVKVYPPISFIIVGDGPERPYLQKLIKDLNLQSKVALAGWKTQKEVAILLSQSHIFLLPSITASDGNEEGIPNALKEAMAMGLPVIATRHAGNAELIENGVSGYLVPQKNVTALTEKMLYLIEHSEEWKSIGMQARKTIEERFETNKNVEQLEALFYELLGV